MTCTATMATASGITGLTLPGMMLLPGCSAGNSISPRPASGPLFIQRRSFEIFSSVTAIAFSAPDRATAVSTPDSAAKLLRLGVQGRPVSSASLAVTVRAKSTWAFTPVPTAVAPRGNCSRAGSRSFETCRTGGNLKRPAGQLLPEGEGHGVHQMSSTGFDLGVEFDCPFVDAAGEMRKRG